MNNKVSNDKNKNFHTDNPISKKEFDTLGRGNFSERIGEAISNYSGLDSLVIGIYGEWGTGKTSVINMIEEAVVSDSKSNKKPIIVNFRPWYFSGQDHLFQQFFGQLAREIVNNLSEAEKKSADKAIKIRRLFKNFILAVEGLNAVVDEVGMPAEKTRKFAIGCLKKTSEHIDNNDQAGISDPMALKKEISETLSKLERKVIIVIDDIDRLTKKEIRQIFQLVKALGDFSNTVYLLSFDKEIVCEALTDVQGGNASRYIEKIIHVPLSLPSIPPNSLRIHLTSNLDKVIGEDFNEELSEYWSSIYRNGLEHYFTNFREVNRFLNLFQFEYSLLRGEVNVVDMIALTAIKSQDSELYQFIHHNKEIFCGPEYGRDNPRYSELLSNKERYCENLKSDYQAKRDSFEKIKTIEPMLKEIFPFFDRLLRGGTDVSQEYKLRGAIRIADSDYFDRIFYLSVPEDQIPTTEVREVISWQDDLPGFIAAIEKYSYEKQRQLIGLFRDHLNEFEKDNLLPIAKALAPMAENEARYDGNTPLFLDSLSLAQNIRFFISESFREGYGPVGTQLDRYKDLFAAEAVGPYMLANLYYEIAREIGAYNRGTIIRKAIEEGEFSEKFLALEDAMLDKLRGLANAGTLLKNNNMVYLLYAWQGAKLDETQDYLKKLLATDDGVVDFVTSLLSYSSDRIPRVPRRHVFDFTDEGELVEKVRNIRKRYEKTGKYSALPKKSKEAIEVLLDSADNPSDHWD